MELSICRKDAVEWLTDEQWIVFSFYGGFARHLERCYFTPGTPKNAEFEVMVAPVAVNGIYGIAPFYRIRDTAENRESLRAALRLMLVCVKSKYAFAFSHNQLPLMLHVWIASQCWHHVDTIEPASPALFGE